MCWGCFSKLRAWNVSVAASGVFLLHCFFNVLAQKLSREAQGGQNAYAKSILWFGGFPTVAVFMLWALEIRFNDHKNMLVLSEKSVGGHVWWLKKNVLIFNFVILLCEVKKRPLKHYHNELYSQISKKRYFVIFFRYLMSNSFFLVFVQVLSEGSFFKIQ